MPSTSLRQLMVSLGLGGVTCLASACSQLVPQDADLFARNFIDTLRTQPQEVVEKFVDPQLAALPSLGDSLTAIRKYLPTATPDTLTLKGASVFWGSDMTQRQIQYEMRAGGQHALVLLVLTERGSVRQISGLRVWPESTSSGQSGHASRAAIVVLLCGILVALFSIYAAIMVVATPMPRRWLWALVTLCGFGKLGVEWHTGAVQTQWLSVQFLGLTYLQGWIAVSLPGGAFLALDRRRRALEASRGATPPPQPQPASAGGDGTPT